VRWRWNTCEPLGTPVLAYIISLHDRNTEGNSRLASLLERNGHVVSFVKAIRGGDFDAYTYYSKINFYFQLTGELISPAELGCALSHGEAYKALCSSDEPRAIILEDDAILDDESCKKLSLLGSLDIDSDSFIHLGGMEGLESVYRPARGILRYHVPRVFEIPSNDLCYILRAVGYIVSRRTAENLALTILEQPFIIDDFVHFRNVSQIRRFYFTRIVRHPLDVSKSSIENEREIKTHWSVKTGTPLISRLMNEIKITIAGRSHQIRALLKKRDCNCLIDQLNERED
jgi:glycosyl transferase family 25